MTKHDTKYGRTALKMLMSLSVFAALFVGEAAAAGAPGTVLQTSVTELEIINLLGRLHELLRNIAYLLGPIILLHGITLWALGSKNSSWSQAGYSGMIGGFILFGLALAMDILLQMAAFIGDV
ncbi:hypothetical protein [Halosimplex pelagicum]|jgi:hypothetical protein|uniref:Uncharacterized protein n=1 Tax=Halosimplex pelagicum TaxID=869886 RepID=A0A7D5T3V5_9EURY|nr:hypothetical protein [Halosimplex pelagicum]QLH82171.1 hypothetical protein HZS54_11385 [Halosimplex pelagicum]